MSKNTEALSAQSLEFDMDAEIDRISSRLREILSKTLRKRGLVVAISGGIDSSVSAALCVKAIGKERVYGLLLPEQDSAAASTSRGDLLARHLGIAYEEFNIAPTSRQLDATSSVMQRSAASSPSMVKAGRTRL